ncbi:MAG: hypothetical protein U5L45_22755 [Saprospiraceae bacterium]|nr:hypothetical protein [Saprospiraceae bacterium]
MGRFFLIGKFILAEKKRKSGSFFRLCPKNEPHSPSRASEASARTSSLDFMYGFKFKNNNGFIPFKIKFFK